MTTLYELRKRYRTQHIKMCKQHEAHHTTRRQKHFRPRGMIYQKLIAIDIVNESAANTSIHIANNTDAIMFEVHMVDGKIEVKPLHANDIYRKR